MKKIAFLLIAVCSLAFATACEEDAVSDILEVSTTAINVTDSQAQDFEIRVSHTQTLQGPTIMYMNEGVEDWLETRLEGESTDENGIRLAKYGLYVHQNDGNARTAYLVFTTVEGRGNSTQMIKTKKVKIIQPAAVTE